MKEFILEYLNKFLYLVKENKFYIFILILVIFLLYKIMEDE